MNHDKLYRDCNPERRSIKSRAVTLLSIIAILGVLGWMTNRDIERHAEIAKQMECVPIEMTMPIDLESVRT